MFFFLRGPALPWEAGLAHARRTVRRPPRKGCPARTTTGRCSAGLPSLRFLLSLWIQFIISSSRARKLPALPEAFLERLQTARAPRAGRNRTGPAITAASTTMGTRASRGCRRDCCGGGQAALTAACSTHHIVWQGAVYRPLRSLPRPLKEPLQVVRSYHHCIPQMGRVWWYKDRLAALVECDLLGPGQHQLGRQLKLP